MSQPTPVTVLLSCELIVIDRTSRFSLWKAQTKAVLSNVLAQKVGGRYN